MGDLMDTELHSNIAEEDLTDLINSITSNGGKATVEKRDDSYYVLATYPLIVEQVVLNNLRLAGGL